MQEQDLDRIVLLPGVDNLDPAFVWSGGESYLVLEVTCQSDPIHRNLLEDIANRFTFDWFEANFDADACDCEDPSSTIDRDHCYRGFLFLDPTQGPDNSAVIAGACIFQWRFWGGTFDQFGQELDSRIFTAWWEANNPEPCWSLQWVWFLPFYRRQGILRTIWPNFREMFGNASGDFYMEAPYSVPFALFLDSLGYTIIEDQFGGLAEWRVP